MVYVSPVYSETVAAEEKKCLALSHDAFGVKLQERILTMSSERKRREDTQTHTHTHTHTERERDRERQRERPNMPTYVLGVVATLNCEECTDALVLHNSVSFN